LYGCEQKLDLCHSWLYQPNLFRVYWDVLDLNELLVEGEDYSTRIYGVYHISPHVRLGLYGRKLKLAPCAPWLCQPNLFWVYRGVFDLKGPQIEEKDYSRRMYGVCHRSPHVRLGPYGRKLNVPPGFGNLTYFGFIGVSLT
jgi:hypothetical protein